MEEFMSDTGVVDPNAPTTQATDSSAGASTDASQSTDAAVSVDQSVSGQSTAANGSSSGSDAQTATSDAASAAAAAASAAASNVQQAGPTPAYPPDPSAAAASAALAVLLEIAGDYEEGTEDRIAACMAIKSFCDDAVIVGLIKSVPARCYPLDDEELC